MSLRDDLLARGLRAWLDLQARPSAIRAALRGQSSPHAAPSTRERVTVAAVQMQFDLLENGVEYARMVYALARQAVERGAQLVAFPEYAWAPLIGMLPGIGKLAAQTRGGLEGVAAQVGEGASLTDILRLVTPPVERAFLATGSEVARKLGIYLMSGSCLHMDAENRLYNVAHLFGPDGAHLAEQKKLHAFTTERDWLSLGDSLGVVPLSFASVAFPVCMDFTYWETTRLAWNAGAEILINCSADSCGDQEYAAARGVRSRVQEVPAYGILVNIVTDLFGLHWRGPSRIVAPIGVDPRGSVLARTASADRAEIVVQELDLVRLREFRAAYDLDPNPVLESRYFPNVYISSQAQDRLWGPNR